MDLTSYGLDVELCTSIEIGYLFWVQGPTILNQENNHYVFSQCFQVLLTKDSASGPGKIK